MSVGGIDNLGNTCYMSAALQCLRASGRFVAMLDGCGGLSEPGRLATALKTALKRPEGERMFAPEELLALSGKLHPQFATYDQQDAHEWLRFLLARLEKFPIVDLFRIRLRSTVECEVCLGVFPREEDALDLSLSIPGEPDKGGWLGGIFGRAKSSSVEECMGFFEKSEILEELYFCEKCKIKRRAKKQIKIVNTPEILCVHLKRFSHPSGGHSWLPSFFSSSATKNSKTVTFAESLTLNGANYQLYAVLQHIGTMGGGHYVAYVRHADSLATAPWIFCDDSRVTRVQSFDRQIKTAEAYMLFFARQKTENFVSEIATISDPVLISSDYLRRLKVLADPGPCMVLLCGHGKLPVLDTANLFETVDRKFAQQISARFPIPKDKINVTIGERKFRRVSFVTDPEICQTCRSEILVEDERRRLSSELVGQEDTRTLPSFDRQWYLVDCSWVTKWRIYTEQHVPDLTGNSVEAISAPLGPVDNRVLAEKLAKHKQDPTFRLSQNSDFFAVNVLVWSLFCLLHGSLGPEITAATLSDLSAVHLNDAPSASELARRFSRSEVLTRKLRNFLH